MHIAAKNGNVDLLKVLYQRGGDVNVQDDEGHTPVHVACRFGHLEILKALKMMNANPNICDICVITMHSSTIRLIIRSKHN